MLRVLEMQQELSFMKQPKCKKHVLFVPERHSDFKNEADWRREWGGF